MLSYCMFCLFATAGQAGLWTLLHIPLPVKQAACRQRWRLPPAATLVTLNRHCCFASAGHTDTVLALDTAPYTPASQAGGLQAVVASASKDNTVKLWDCASGQCLGVGDGHVAAVSAVAFTRRYVSWLSCFWACELCCAKMCCFSYMFWLLRLDRVLSLLFQPFLSTSVTL